MLLAIDVGNTDTKFGLWSNNEWLGIWRRPTHDGASADSLVSWLSEGFVQAGLEPAIERVGCVAVVPARIATVDELARSLTRKNATVVSAVSVSLLPNLYQSPQSLGADRFASALGALKQFKPAVIVVDFGSATTVDLVTEEGFLGGAILPGPRLQVKSVVSGTALLPEVPLTFPPNVVGNNTTHCLQSGILFGHIGAVEGLVKRFNKVLDLEATVVATGGLSHLFMGATSAIHHFVPTLTLDGVIVGMAQSLSLD